MEGAPVLLQTPSSSLPPPPPPPPPPTSLADKNTRSVSLSSCANSPFAIHQRKQQQISVDEKTTQNSNDFLKLDFTKLSRLIGRSKERKILSELHFNLIKKGSIAEIVLVHGESGVGKSTLIQYLQDKVQQKTKIGYFVSGKYDQQISKRPYSAIADAMTDLCQQVKNDPKFHRIQKELTAALSNETTGALTNLIPSLVDVLAPSNNDKAATETTTTKTATTTNQKENDEQHPPPPSPTLLTTQTPGTPPPLRRKLSRQPSESSIASKTTNASSATANGFSFQIFVHAFRTLLKAFCQPSRPLIIFLDDLQWADGASRKLIAALSSNTSIENLLLVAAYRDNDEAIFKLDRNVCKLNVIDMPVGPLSLSNIEEIICTVTGLPQQTDIPDIQGLSQVVLEKTGGNIFFAIQYLEALHRQQLLFYDFGITKWNWNIDQIRRSTAVSDNIVGLLIGKIQTLPKILQSILMFAACLGFTFDIEVLEGILISEKVIRDPLAPDSKYDSNNGDNIEFASIMELLQILAKQGLVHQFNDRKYQFSHDRVQQSANALIPAGSDGDMLHLRIGEFILQYCNAPEAESWMLFRAVDLLSQQSKYIGTKVSSKNNVSIDLLDLANLNLQAANEAVLQMAFIPALQYVQQGISLMNPQTMWIDHYEFCLQLHVMHAKMQHACGDYASCLDVVQVILDNATSLQDQLPAYYQRVIVNGENLKVKDAISEARHILKILGFNIPAKPSKLHVMYEYIKTQRVLNGRTAKDLVWLPSMTNPQKIAAMKFLTRLVLNSNEAEQFELSYVCSILMARTTIKYGICANSVFGLTAYGVLLAALGNVDAGFEFVPLGLELLKRPETQIEYAAGIHTIYAYLDHLRNPIQDGLPKLLEGYNVGMQIGETEFSTISLMGHVISCATVGMPLDNLERQIHSYCELFREFGQELRLSFVLPYYQLTLNLAGKSSNPLLLTGDAMVEEEFLAKLQQSKNTLAISGLHFVRMMTRYLFGAFESADYDRRYIDNIDDGDTHVTRYFCFMYSALICFAMARKDSRKKNRYIRQSQRYVNRLSKYVKDGSVNGVPMLKIVMAESLTLKEGNNVDEVKDAFDVAIRFSRRSGFRIITSIALERAGDYFYSVGDVSTASDYLEGAFFEYEGFCAFGKSKLLLEKYPWLQVDNNKTDAAFRRSTASNKMKANVLTSLKDRDLDYDKSLMNHSVTSGSRPFDLTDTMSNGNSTNNNNNNNYHQQNEPSVYSADETKSALSCSGDGSLSQINYK